MSTIERRTDRKHHNPRHNSPLLSWYALFFLLCLLLLPTPAYAQEPGPTTWEWRNFNAENSPLAPGWIREIMEDRQGRIWIQTNEGLSLYQAGIWQTFTAENSPLALAWVSVLLVDTQGRIWVGTRESWTDIGGLSLYQDGTWQTFTAENSPIAPGWINVLLEDSQGRIWVGTSGGLSFYQGETWQTFTAENSALILGEVRELLEDSQGRIWVGTWRGLSLYRAGAWQTFTTENSPLVTGGIWELLEDSQGRIWVGTDEGVSLYQDGTWQTFTADSSPLAPGEISELAEDSRGRIWVGTSGGISLYQDGTWQTFTTENSPQAPGGVSEFFEDSQGRIWVGTSGGISLYQDKAWQTFTTENSSLAPGSVSEFFEESQGRIWVRTGRSSFPLGIPSGWISVYKDGVWQTLTLRNSPLVSGMVRELLEDSQGRIWVGTDWGLSLYQAGAWQTFTAENSPLAPRMIRELLEDSQGRIWACTEESLSLYQDGTWQTFPADNFPLAAGGVEMLLEDSQGRIWVGTSGGVSLYQDGNWQTFTAENSPLAAGRIWELLEDSQGRIWVGTSGGVSLYQDGNWQTFTADNSPLVSGMVRELLEDSQGRIWVGTEKGVSLYRDGVWRTVSSDNSPLGPGRIQAFMEDSQGRIWVRTTDYDRETGTDRGGVSLYQVGAWQTFTSDNSPLASGEIQELQEDSQGRIWVWTEKGVSLYYDGAWRTFSSDNSPLEPGRIQAFMEDSQGRIWVRTADWETGAYGLSLYQNRVWQTFTAENSPLIPGEVRGLLEDSQGRIWIRTGEGLSLYQDGTWQTFTADNSPLAAGWVEMLLEDSQGRMWVGTYEWPDIGGISLYQNGVWQTFTADNSPLAPGRVRELLEDSQGRIWVCTEGGLSVRHPGDRPCALLHYAGLAPGQTSSSLRATADLTFTFPSPRSTLEMGFAGIDAESDTDRLLFRCQLVGYDEEEAPCASPVRYPALPPGTYTFRVRALDEDLMSSEPATATITLISTAPPTPTPIPALTPTPRIIEVERVVPGLPREAVIPLFGGMGGVVALAACGAVVRSKVHRARRLAAWRKGADPYIVGDVVEEPKRFYGREEALTELLRALEAGNHVAVYGERRIGKTSLLHQLAHQLQDQPYSKVHFLPAFVSLQMVLESRFFYALANATTRAAARDLEQKNHSHPSLRVDDRPEGYDSLDLADDLEAIIEALREAKGRSPRIVLLLDEADKMNGYAPQTQEALRGLLMTPVGGHVKLVWSGQTMNREWHLESSPWFNLFKREIHLGSMEEESAVRLIREPVKGVFTYDDEAIQRILELTSREPYPIQRLCSLCVRRMLRENRFRITIDDVSAAWQELQAEDTRRAAEGATEPGHRAPRQVWAVAEDGTEYHTDEENEP